MKDASVSDFVSEERVADAFVRLLCESYARTVQYGLTPKPNFVTKATQERATDGQETLEDLLRSKFVFYPGDIQSDFMRQNGKFDWAKVGDWWMKVNNVNDECRWGTAASSKTTFRQKLERLGVTTHTRKMQGVAVRIYIGLRRPLCSDEQNDNDSNDNNQQEEEGDCAGSQNPRNHG